MSALTIRTLPDPVLRERARPVEKILSRHRWVIQEMKRLVRQAGGIGLAANQVGILERIIVVDAGKGKLLGLINPVILWARGSTVELEGCLSIPGTWGKVERAETIGVAAFDEYGKPVSFVATGMLARVIQHEIDHLDGVLFVDKMIEPAEQEPIATDQASEERGSEDDAMRDDEAVHDGSLPAALLAAGRRPLGEAHDESAPGLSQVLEDGGA